MVGQRKKAKTDAVVNRLLRTKRNPISSAVEETVLLGKVSEKVDVLLNKLNKMEGVITRKSNESVINDSQDSAVPSTSTRANDGLQTVYLLGNTQEKPTYNGSFANPVSFLKQLKRYLKCINAGDNAIDIALGCIRGPAKRVLELDSNNWKTFNDFEKDFLDTFWGVREQESVRRRLYDSTWDPNGGATMEEYYAEMVELVRDLSQIDEEAAVNQIMRHYPEHVQMTWFASTGADNFKGGLQFIRKIERNVRRQPHGMNLRTERNFNGDKQYHGRPNIVDRNRGSGLEKNRGVTHRHGSYRQQKTDQINTISFVRESEVAEGEIQSQMQENRGN